MTMRLLTGRAADGLPVPLLLSVPSQECRAAIVHVHGWGGDFCANEFVRRSHDFFPQAGIAFASVNLRSSGYLNEKYSENSVRYVGSSVTDPEEVFQDIEAAIEAIDVPPHLLVLQGHSFGSNLVRVFASRHNEVERIILLSPSDSVALHREWVQRATPAPRSQEQIAESIEPIIWTGFGMAADDAGYPIPIRASVLDRLLLGDAFRAWSGGGAETTQAALVVLGEDDPIAAVGLTGSNDFFERELRSPHVVRLGGARHLFAGHVDALLAVELHWLEQQFLATP